MKKMFEAIGKVTTRILCVVAGIYIAAIMPLWLGAILCVCAFIALVLSELEE